MAVGGVDLNRNYGYNWNKGIGTSSKGCSEMYSGTGPFSEPETQVMRDFLLSKKNELKFVSNFHSFGPALVIPDNANFPSTIESKFPKVSKFMDEMIADFHFESGTDIMPSVELLSFLAGGAAGDWITQTLGIPAMEPEIGSAMDFINHW